MNFAVLLAGGIGARMQGSKLPKQFLKLGGEPILRLTVDKFLACSRIDYIIVAVPALWLNHAKELLCHKRFSTVRVCQGGQTRQDSLYNAIKYIVENFQSTSDDIVVSHDIARPFVSLRVIEENIDAMKMYDAVDTVIPATDTIVESDDSKTIACIQDRSRMYQGQTPQTFHLGTYLTLYESLDASYLEKITDAARILVEHGCSVGLVRGDAFNIKITNEYDFHIAQFLVGACHD